MREPLGSPTGGGPLHDTAPPAAHMHTHMHPTVKKMMGPNILSIWTMHKPRRLVTFKAVSRKLSQEEPREA